MLANTRCPLAGLLFLVVAQAPAVRAQDQAASVDLPPVSVEQFLPVQTPKLSVEAFEAERRPTGVMQPFFLIGCDDTSVEWMRSNRERLIELRAFGLVVDAPSVDAYRRLEAVAEGLVIRPVAGDLLAEHLGIRHYPVLVTAGGLFP